MLSRIFMLTVVSAFTVSAAARSAEVTAKVQAELAKLPGNTGFAFTEVTADKPKLLSGVRENERFAVGSSFKLFILGTLAAEVNAGERQLDDIMLISAELEGPPASELATWPVGAPVTLNTLALKMISISDNTATDHLLDLLGAERIEKQMALMGHHHPELNTPLLSTRQMTMLRDKKTGMPGTEYNKLDSAARRAFLQKLSAGKPDYESLDFDTAAFDVAEWYATPLDMAAALSWIKRNTETSQPAHLLRADIAVEQKLTHDPKVWPYVGFKGGSEDQLLAGNWLLKHENGRWYTFHVYWNNPQGAAEPKPFIEAIETIFMAVQDSLK